MQNPETKSLFPALHFAGTLMNGRSNTRKEFNQPRDTKMMRSQSNAWVSRESLHYAEGWTHFEQNMWAEALSIDNFRRYINDNWKNQLWEISSGQNVDRGFHWRHLKRDRQLLKSWNHKSCVDSELAITDRTTAICQTTGSMNSLQITLVLYHAEVY